MAPLLPLRPKQLLTAGVLAGAVCALPATATFGKGKSKVVLPRPPPLFVPAPSRSSFPGHAIISEPDPLPELLGPPTDALFYDISPKHADPAFLAEVKCDSAATAEPTPGKTAVDFSGYVTWQNGRFPQALPKPTFLTVELQDASSDKVQDRPLLYVYKEEVSDLYVEGQPIRFSFCARVPEVEHYGLYARVVSAAALDSKTEKFISPASRMSFAGLTDTEAGLKGYRDVRVRLFNAIPRDTATQAATDKDDIAGDEPKEVPEEEPQVEGAHAGSDAGVQHPASEAVDVPSSPPVAVVAVPDAMPKEIHAESTEVCNFSDLLPGTRGVAARVIMDVPLPLASTTALPKPSVLTVLLEEMLAPDVPDEALTTEREPLAVFSSDITEWYRAGEALTALLCAQIPIQSDEEVSYKLRSLLNIGWDGYEESAEDETESDVEAAEPLQQLRSGDYMAETTLVVEPEKDSYVVKAPLVPYEP